MRLDWIFLPRENPCFKFYIIIIIIIIIASFRTSDLPNMGLEKTNKKYTTTTTKTKSARNIPY